MPSIHPMNEAEREDREANKPEGLYVMADVTGPLSHLASDCDALLAHVDALGALMTALLHALDEERTK